MICISVKSHGKFAWIMQTSSFFSFPESKEEKAGFSKGGIVFPSDWYSKSDSIAESKVHHIPDKASCLPDCSVTIEL